MSTPFVVLETEHIVKLLNAPKTTTLKGKRDRAMLAVLFSTGVRVSELTAMNRSDIKEGNRITVFGKRGKYRLVMLSPAARERLDIYLRTRTDTCPALFTDVYGRKRLTVRMVQIMVKTYAWHVGLPDGVHTHTIRHSFAVEAMRNNADIREVQVLLGHASPKTTAIYLAFNDRMLEQAHRDHHNSSEVYKML